MFLSTTNVLRVIISLGVEYTTNMGAHRRTLSESRRQIHS